MRIWTAIVFWTNLLMIGFMTLVLAIQTDWMVFRNWLTFAAAGLATIALAAMRPGARETRPGSEAMRLLPVLAVIANLLTAGLGARIAAFVELPNGRPMGLAIVAYSLLNLAYVAARSRQRRDEEPSADPPDP